MNTTKQPFVPVMQHRRTAPAHCGKSGRAYTSLDVNGDAGTTAAVADALAQIASGEGQQITDLIEHAAPGPIETKWGLGFRRYAECLEHIEANGPQAPVGGVALPMRYTVMELPSYSVVPSNAIWHDKTRSADVAKLAEDERDNARRTCTFRKSCVMHVASRTTAGISPHSAQCMDKLGIALASCDSQCNNFYDSAEVRRVFYPEMEKLLLEFYPDATDALVYNHDVFDKDYDGDRTEDQDAKNPGVNANYANLVHNDLNDNSGRVRCRELLTRNLRNFGREHTTRRSRQTRKCPVVSCRLIWPSPWRRSSKTPLCSALGRLSPISPISRTTGSTMTGSVKPRGLPTGQNTSGTGYPSSSLTRCRCSNVMSRYSMARYRDGHSTRPVSTPRLQPTLVAERM